MTSNNREAEAFTRMLANGMLPKPYTPADANALCRAGIRLSGNDVIVKAVLPLGWKTVQTDPRHGDLLDDRGRVRATFFFKDTPHERRGRLQMKSRYTTFSGRPGNPNWCAWDSASEVTLFENPTAPKDAQYEQAKKWLNRHFPNWEDLSSYSWDDADSSRPWWQFWK